MYVLAIDTAVYYNLHWFVMIFKRYPVSDYDCHQESSTLSICALFTWTKYLLYERRRYTVIQCPKALLASSLLPSCAPSALPPPPRPFPVPDYSPPSPVLCNQTYFTTLTFTLALNNWDGSTRFLFFFLFFFFPFSFPFLSFFFFSLQHRHWACN